jgi:hypothetical protein
MLEKTERTVIDSKKDLESANGSKPKTCTPHEEIKLRRKGTAGTVSPEKLCQRCEAGAKDNYYLSRKRIS